MSRPEPPTLIFVVEGMHCASCGLLVDDLVVEVPGVASSTTHVPSGRTVVAVADGAPGDAAAVAAAIAEAGYLARPLA